MADFWRKPPNQDDVFNYKVNLQRGNIMNIENLDTFKTYWHNKGGISAFQNHIQKIIKNY